MTKNEIAYIVGFLTALDDQFGNDTCNDMYITDTPENREMYVAAEKLFLEECTPDEEMTPVEEAIQVPYGSRSKEKKIGTDNRAILGYLRQKLMKEFGLEESEIPETNNW